MPKTLPAAIDVHMHVVANGTCNSGSWINSKFAGQLDIAVLKKLNGVTRSIEENSLDDYWGERLSQIIAESRIDYGVGLGFDGVYDHNSGKLLADKSQLIIPPSWIFTLAKRHGNILPGPSINPFRSDALALLDEVIEKGAVLLKMIPSVQGIDLEAAKIETFLSRMAAAGLPLLVHVGTEETFKDVEPAYSDLKKIIKPLKMGVKVICAHAGGSVLYRFEKDRTQAIEGLLHEFEHLYLDNSGLCNPSRFLQLPRLARNEFMESRTLFGTDWPIPIIAAVFLGRLPMKKIVQLQRLKNPIDRDIEIKHALGIKEDHLYRAHRVLSNLDQWIRVP